ncbi:MAG: cupin domain-containing protein [Candidatus Acidiferrales bacterium]
MTSIRMWASLALMISFAAVAAGNQVELQDTAHAEAQKGERDRVAFSHELPELNGGKLRATVVKVNYGPGESSAPHGHPCPVIGYVVEGTLRTQVKGEPVAIYKAGESFYEATNGVHLISANASDKLPLKLLAYFVCDRDAPLSIAAPEANGTGGE